MDPCEIVAIKKLIYAVIERAILDALGADITYSDYRQVGSYVKKKRVFDARDWIASEDLSSWSFEWCCDELGIQPSRVRRAVEELIPLGRAGIGRKCRKTSSSSLLARAIEQGGEVIEYVRKKGG